ncbi:DUF6770 family protein [Sediminitomix flava]|uniref:YD repeat-containing protein n=1 Tax=Sediminitomix flava TaxID=379075 RepID=A0A315Z8W3_SEDFL|nr:DUF6770 family protein [Sediminitomix flava]PWJ42005.1 YD repeat-containing protein [Sediminitomix flava]
MIRSLSLILILLSMSILSYAQEVFHSKEGLVTTKVQQMQAIQDEEGQVSEVFYTAKSGNLLTIVRLSNEGEEIKEFSVDLSKGVDFTQTRANFNADYQLDQIVFNGEAFALMVSTNQTKVLLSYDLEGELLGVKPIRLDYKRNSTSKLVEGWNHVKLVASSYDQSFVAVFENTVDHRTFEVVKIGNDLEPKWENPFKVEIENGFKYNEALSVEVFYDRIFFINFSKKTVNSRVADPKLYSLDSESGEVLFKFPLVNENTTLFPSKIHIDTEENIVLSGDYYSGTKIRKMASDGVFLMKLDPTGSPIVINKDSWAKDIQKQMKQAKSFQIAKIKPFFHDITVKEDGGYQVIAETFFTEGAKRTAAFLGSLAEVAGAVTGVDLLEDVGSLVNTTAQLLSINPNAKVIGYPVMEDEAPRTIKVKDLLVFDYDDQGNLLEVRLIKKPKTSIQSYYYGYQGLKLAKLIDEYGYFDYQFFMGSGDERKLVYYKDDEASAVLGIASVTTGEEIKNQNIILGGVAEKAQKGQVGFVKFDDENVLYFHFYVENNSTKLDIFKQSTVIEL